MSRNNELSVLNAILDFQIKEIPEDTHFWMIRTKKGYFYNEFIGKKFIALAWNAITSSTSFSDSFKEGLCDEIVVEYPEIKRPTTVINKCKSFIHEVKENDIIVIPSAGSKYITFALVGAYFEDSSKTVELEKAVIKRIEDKDVEINEVSCPYKKRRYIEPIITVRSEEINYSLYRAISNYHGISSLDNYSRYILNMLYNVYSFKNNVNLIFNVRKTSPIGPRLLSGILYGTTNYLSTMGIEEDKISTQININSPGPIDFSIIEIFNLLKDNYLPIIAMLVVAGGGSFLTFKLPGIPQIIKDILTLPNSIEKEKLEKNKLELEIIEKKVVIHEKIRSLGINPEDLKKDLDLILKNAKELDVQPVENNSIGSNILNSDIAIEDDIEDE